MARATTKPDLIGAAGTQFEKLWKLIDSMPDKEQNADLQYGDGFKGKEAHW